MAVDPAVLASLELFRDLTAEQLLAVGAIGKELPFEVNQLVFEEGSGGTDIYVVCYGSVRISKMIPGFGEEAIGILEAGASVGEMMLVENDTPVRSADARAHTSCILGALPREPFRALLSSRTDIASVVYRNLSRILARRLRDTNERFRALFAMSARW